jgi:radical SAM protein with 4Fe4S-binding SPASM domain
MVMIEPTNICNLKCPLCPSGVDTLTRERGFMSMEVYKKIVDQIHRYSFGLILWNQGEPFLHPDFYEMLRYANEKKLYLMVSTNANMEFLYHELIDTGLDLLIVSLDGATQETYNKYRINGSLEFVEQNVKKLVEAKESRKKKTPLIVWQFLVMKHNESEVGLIQKLSDGLNVDLLVYKSVQIYDVNDIEEFLPTDPKYRRYKITENTDGTKSFEIPIFKNRCYRIWGQPVINWDGEMSVCCFDKDNFIRIGNISDGNFINLWKSEKFYFFRKNILTDRKMYEICRNCGEGAKLQV